MYPQATLKSAQFAEIRLARNTLSAALHSRDYTIPTADARLQLEWHSQSDCRSEFLTLLEICHQIRRSKSWIYEHGIVPLTDANGSRVDAGKKPPFPWLALPPPCIDFGKKLWAKADVDRWLLSIRARVNRPTDASSESVEVAA